MLSIMIFILACNASISQKYFDLFSTNVPKSEYNKYSLSFNGAYGWLGTGNYSWPSDCKDCFDYSRDSKLKKENLDSLVRVYKQASVNNIYSKMYVPNNKYFITEKVKAPPYITKTLYKIDANKPIALQQIKITFFNRPNSQPGVLNIEIMNEKAIKQYDPKIVMSSYNNKLKEDAAEAPPRVEKIKD